MPGGGEARDVLRAERHVAAEDRVERLVGAGQTGGERAGHEPGGEPCERGHDHAPPDELGRHRDRHHHRRPQRAEPGCHLAQRAEVGGREEDVDEPHAQRGAGQDQRQFGNWGAGDPDAHFGQNCLHPRPKLPR